MRYFWQWFCGYVCICVKGRQVSRFLNLCSRNGIHLWRISYDLNHALHANLRLRDFYDIKPYLRKTRSCIRVISKRGFPFWCYRHRRLKWFLCFILLVIGVGLYSLNFIWSIEIRGNEKVSNEEILDYLIQNDIVTGQKKGNIDCSQIEIVLRERFLEFGWVSVYVEHTNLCIDIKESLYDEIDVEEDYLDQSYHLVANKDAIIYSIVTREGKALVKAGQTVKEGDILVLGECEIYDDAGAVKDILYFPADALIYADVMYEFILVPTEMELVSLNIAGAYNDTAFMRLANQKLVPILNKFIKNEIIILDKSIVLEKEDKNIRFKVKLYTRERIGNKVPAEEVRENEFE